MPDDVADACHERGLGAVAVTAGYINPEARADFYAHLDAANVDLKGFTEEFYRDVVDGSLQLVVEVVGGVARHRDEGGAGSLLLFNIVNTTLGALLLYHTP